MMSLDGKTSFPWSAHIGPKPGNSQACYFSNVGYNCFLLTVRKKENKATGQIAQIWGL